MMSEETIQRCLDAVVIAAVEPTLVKLENETGQQISVNVRVVLPNTTLGSCRNLDEKTATATGEVRIALKESFGGAVRFSCQAILRGLMPSTGFSGFSVQGKVDLAPSKDDGRIKGCAYHYNLWEWKREYTEHSA